MAVAKTCDRCGKPITSVKIKLFLSPVNGKQGRSDHSNYSGHADIGECCAGGIVQEIHWQKRRSQKKPANV